MSQKQAFEHEVARRFLELLGVVFEHVLVRDKPDVIARIDGRDVGIEVTVLHPDDCTVGSGSRLRQEEKKRARGAAGAAYAMWGHVSPFEAMRARIRDKTNKSYHRPSGGELWLLIAYGIPEPGQLASTYVFPQTLHDFSQNLTLDLQDCGFGCVFFYDMIGGGVVEWSSRTSWAEREPGTKLPEDSEFFDIMKNPEGYPELFDDPIAWAVRELREGFAAIQDKYGWHPN